MARVAVAAVEQQLLGDGPLARQRMQAVGEPKQPVVVLRIGQVEDVLVHDDDAADERVRALELRIRGDGLRGLMAGMRRGGGGRRHRQEEQHGQERRERVRSHDPEDTATVTIAERAGS